MSPTRRSRTDFGSTEFGALAALVVLFFAVAAISVATSSRVGSAGELPQMSGVSSGHFQASEDQRVFTGELVVAREDMLELVPYLRANRVELTLPAEGAVGPVEGEFRLEFTIPGPVMYVAFTELAEEIGSAIAESVAGPLTVDDIEEAGIEVPPEWDDCVIGTSVRGDLNGTLDVTIGGAGDGTIVFTGEGCEDTEATIGGGVTTEQAVSWTATLSGDLITGTIVLVDEFGDRSEFAFEATLGEAPSGLACPSVDGYEEGFGSGDILAAGDRQLALICRYLSEEGGSFQLSARWDFEEGPADQAAACGLPRLEDTLDSGNIYGYIYSPAQAAHVSWSETSPTGLSHGQLGALVAPLLPAAEAQAVACPSAATSVGGGGGSVTSGDLGPSDTVGGGDEPNGFTDFLLGDGGDFEVTPEEAAVAAAAATGAIALTTLVTVLLSGGAAPVGAGSTVAADVLGGEDRVTDDRSETSLLADSGGGRPASTVSTQPGAEPDVDPGPILVEPEVRSRQTIEEVFAETMGGTTGERPRVEPLDPGLPELDDLPATRVAPLDPGLPAVGELPALPTAPLNPAARDNWALLGADGAGRVYDRHGQHIATIGRDGSLTDLNGRPIQEVSDLGEGVGITGFVDADGRVIEYSRSGAPFERVAMENGDTRFVPLTDVSPVTTGRPVLESAARATWTRLGAGPDGELYGADGSVIGFVDAAGEMRTVDGRVITGHADPIAGRLDEVRFGDGEALRTPGAEPVAPGAPDVDSPAARPAGGSNEDLADLVAQSRAADEVRAAAAEADRVAAEAAAAERAASQDADTSMRGPDGPVSEPPSDADTAMRGPETRDSGPPSDAAAVTPPADGDTRMTSPPADGGPDGPPAAPVPDAPAPDAPTPTPPDGPTAPDRPAGVGPDADGPRTAEVGADGPRGMDALGGAMDLQGLIDSVQQDLAQGRGVGEAATRAVTSAWAGNAIGDAMALGGGGVQNVSTTLVGSALLPGGVNNLLPDQFAANAVTTGLDAWSGIVEDTATSLGGGEVSTEGMERFADSLANRPGADPFAGYARLGELMGEELGDADMSVMDLARNLGEDLQRMDEQDVFVEQGLEAAASFEQEAFEGKHGTVLRGLSQATRVATDPPSPSQFAEDATNIGRAMYEEFTGGGGPEGGMGPGFWEEIAEHNNETVRGIPVVGTVFDGYAQMASGMEESGVGGFSTEMYEGGAALAEEGMMMASDQASQAYEAASQQAAAAYDAVSRWF